MIWDDFGYLVSKNRYNENSIIAEFYTKDHGKTTGLIFGATSKKIKNYLLIGNYFSLNYNTKNDNRSGYFKIEISKLNTPHYLEDNIKLSAIIYAMNLIKILTVESQANNQIYLLIEKFYKILKNDSWIKEFILWELNVLKNLGYDLNFNDYVIKKKINGIEKFIVKNDINKTIPNFLVNNISEPSNKDELIIGFKLVGDFLDKTILKPNNITYPVTRSNLINLLT